MSAEANVDYERFLEGPNKIYSYETLHVAKLSPGDRQEYETQKRYGLTS